LKIAICAMARRSASVDRSAGERPFIVHRRAIVMSYRDAFTDAVVCTRVTSVLRSATSVTPSVTRLIVRVCLNDRACVPWKMRLQNGRDSRFWPVASFVASTQGRSLAATRKCLASALPAGLGHFHQAQAFIIWQAHFI
jgi:hypothetical protein